MNYTAFVGHHLSELEIWRKRQQWEKGTSESKSKKRINVVSVLPLLLAGKTNCYFSMFFINKRLKNGQKYSPI